MSEIPTKYRKKPVVIDAWSVRDLCVMAHKKLTKKGFRYLKARWDFRDLLRYEKATKEAAP